MHQVVTKYLALYNKLFIMHQGSLST